MPWFWRCWPGNGPWSDLPPWERPGWLFGRGWCWQYFINTSTLNEREILENEKRYLEEKIKEIENKLKELEGKTKSQ